MQFSEENKPHGQGTGTALMAYIHVGL